MSLSPIEEVQGRRIGAVDYVSPAEIKVSLELDAPSNTAINAGSPRSFPRINNYLLIPVEDGFVVGQVEWLAVENSPFPKRKGFQDFGLVDLPFPQRKLSLSPVGTLVQSSTKSISASGSDKEITNPPFIFKRGVYTFPTVGDPVLLPTNEQLRNIIESGENRHLFIGHAPMAGNAEVRVDPDRLFGRHLAVLGNTGSGKSCTVAGLIRWSMEAARATGSVEPNARFIILDPNGEFKAAFSDDEKLRHFFAEAKRDGGSNEEQLRVPVWFWNAEEWATFSQAAARAQRPLLRKALRLARSPQDVSNEDNEALRLRRKLSIFWITLRADMAANNHKNRSTQFGHKLDSYQRDFTALAVEFPTHAVQLNGLATHTNNVASARKSNAFYNPFDDDPVSSLIVQTKSLADSLGGVIPTGEINEDTPIQFNGAEFTDLIEDLAEQEGVSQWIDFLVMRIRTILGDSRMKNIIGEEADISLDEWLRSYVGDDQAANGTIAIVDLSIVPTEIVNVVAAVIARMVFETLQRYRKLHPAKKTLPTVLVMEEAHTFIRRYKDDSEEISSSVACCRVFEKIAREGRKFGLGLVLSSQRPSELSPTVLSQCNSFLLHRISNDKDQETVTKLLPDHLRGILRELPVLPTRHAFLLGWASELPILTSIRELPKSQQPQSDDPDFWAVWTGKDTKENVVERKIDWKKLVDDWQGKTAETEDAPTDATENQSSDSPPENDDVPF